MVKHLPFYMVYDTDDFKKDTEWNKYICGDKMGEIIFPDEESLSQRDYDYMKSTYPDMAKRIMPYVEEECERLEYSGSMMFDEYPDQLQLLLLCRRIYRKVVDKEKWGEIRNGEDNLREKNGLYELVQVMTYHEILRRRSEYRKYRRRFY